MDGTMKVIENLKHDLFMKIWAMQKKTLSAGRRFNRRSLPEEYKLLDSAARICSLLLDVTCSAVYIDASKPEVIIATNHKEEKRRKGGKKEKRRKNVGPDEICKVWQQQITAIEGQKVAVCEKYLKKLIENCSEKTGEKRTVNGYMSYDQCETLEEKLRDVYIHLTIREVQPGLADALESFSPAITKFCQAIRSGEEGSVLTDKYVTMVEKAKACAAELKKWKKSLVSDNPLGSRRLWDCLKLKYDCSFTDSVGEIRNLLYDIKRLDSDVERLTMYFQRDSNRQLKDLLPTLPYVENNKIHSEVKIINFMNNKGYFKENTCRYLGISKLCCATCRAFLESLPPCKIKVIESQESTREIPRILVKGFHGKLYFGWEFPGDVDRELAAASLRQLAAMYQMGLLHGRRQLQDAASTNTSGSCYSLDFSEMEDVRNEFFGNGIRFSEMENVREVILELLSLHYEYKDRGIAVFNASLYVELEGKRYEPKDVARALGDNKLLKVLEDLGQTIW